MIISSRTAATVTFACLMSATFLGGCEDTAAQQRDAVQQTIAQASIDFRKATAGYVGVGDDDYESRQRELNALIGRVGSLQGAEPGQQAAAWLLAAEALGELASMNFDHLLDLERRHRADRDVLAGSFDGAVRLNAAAAAQSSVSTTRERESLQQKRASLDAALRELQQRMTSLEAPISDRTRRNMADAEEANRLRADANDLIRRAIELGHSRGFPSFEEAINIRRDADEIDYEVALREIELEYELQPEHELAQWRAGHNEQALASIRRTLEEFDQLEQTFASDVAATRQSFRELGRSVAQSLDRIHEDMNSVLADRYEEILSQLDRAAGQARQAAGRLRGEAGNAARMLQAGIHENQARVQWARARAAAEQAALLSSVIEAGEVIGNGSTYRNVLNDLQQVNETAVEAAQAAIAEAEQALAAVTGRAAQGTAAFRESLETISRSLSGQPARRSQAGASDRSRSSAPAAGGPVEGFASPDDAIAFLRSIEPGDPQQIERLFAAVDESTPQAAATKRMMRKLIDAAADLETAIQERFGDVDTESIGLSATPTFEDARIDSRSDSRVTIVYGSEFGQDTMDLIQRDGVWLIDGESIDQAMPGMEEMDPAELEQMIDTLANAMSDIAQKVRNGEIESPEEVAQAMFAAMMQMMQMMQ